MRRFVLYFTAVAALVAPVRALAVAEFYSISRSVRALGMGGAFYGLSDDDGALFYNPAGLALVRGGERFNVVGLHASFSPNLFGLVDVISNGSGKSAAAIAQQLEQFQGQAIHAGPSVSVLSMYRKNFGLAILLPDAKVNFGLLGSGVDTSIDATAIVDAGVIAGFGTAIPGTGLRVGVNGKGLVRAGGRRFITVDDIAAGNSFTFEPRQLGGAGLGIDFDVGAIYEFEVPAPSLIVAARAGVTLSNLLASNFSLTNFTGSAPPQLPRMFTLGGSIALRGYGPFDNFNFLLDFAEFGIGGQSNPHLGGRGGSFWKHVNLGVEAPMGIFSPRLGLHQGYWTAGFSFDVRVAKLVFATFAEELATGVGRFPNRRYMARLELGWGSAPPPPLLGTERGGKEAGKSGEKKDASPVSNGGQREGLSEAPKPADPPSAALTPAPESGNPVDASGVPLNPPQLEVDKLVPQTEGPNPSLPRGQGNVPTPVPTAAPEPTAPQAAVSAPRARKPTRKPASVAPRR